MAGAWGERGGGRGRFKGCSCFSRAEGFCVLEATAADPVGDTSFQGVCNQVCDRWAWGLGARALAEGGG